METAYRRAPLPQWWASLLLYTSTLMFFQEVSKKNSMCLISLHCVYCLAMVFIELCAAVSRLLISGHTLKNSCISLLQAQSPVVNQNLIMKIYLEGKLE